MAYHHGSLCGQDNCDSERWLRIGATREVCENGHERARYDDGVDGGTEDYHIMGDRTVKKKEKVAKQNLSKCYSVFEIARDNSVSGP